MLFHLFLILFVSVVSSVSYAFTPPTTTVKTPAYDLIVDDGAEFVLDHIIPLGSDGSASYIFGEIDLGKGARVFITKKNKISADLIRLSERSVIHTLGNSIEINANTFDGTEFHALSSSRTDDGGTTLGSIDTRDIPSRHNGKGDKWDDLLNGANGVDAKFNSPWPNYPGYGKPSKSAGNGENGEAGIPGERGRDGGRVLLTTNNFWGGGFITSGGSGGCGGRGGNGGKGGGSGPDRPVWGAIDGERSPEIDQHVRLRADTWLPALGGIGGDGGLGGAGGDGGSVTIKTGNPASAAGVVAFDRNAHFYVNSDGGLGGLNGKPGDGGAFGDMQWPLAGDNSYINEIVSGPSVSLFTPDYMEYFRNKKSSHSGIEPAYPVPSGRKGEVLASFLDELDE